MKLVFDDGSEQEIRQEDFYDILIHAFNRSKEMQRMYKKEIKDALEKDLNSVAKDYMKFGDLEQSIATICKTLLNLYF